MYGREELYRDKNECGTAVYNASKADKVMDAMETRIKELEGANKLAVIVGNKQAGRFKELEEKYKRLLGENQGNFNAMSIAIDGWEKRECELLERIKELESQLPKWISVKDKLPEKYGPYLVIHEDCKGGNAMDVYYYLLDETEGPVWVYDYQEVTSVTHWMPLPPSPTTEEK